MLIGADQLVPVDASQVAVVLNPLRYCRDTVTIDVGGVRCAVHFDHEEAARCFARRYADLAVAPGPCERHAFAMHDDVFGWLFWSTTSSAYRWPHGDLEPDIVAFLADAVALTAFFQHRDDGMLSLHAATLGVAGGVAAIIGDSNGGKTTTALACLRRGMTLYSDERCLVDPAFTVHPFPRALNVRGPGLALLAQDVVPGADRIGLLLRSREAGDWNDLRISELAPNQSCLEPQPLRAAFLLAGTAAEAGLEPASPSILARASIRWAQGAGAGLDKVERLVALFAGVACYRLWLGTPDASAHLIHQTLEAETTQVKVTA